MQEQVTKLLDEGKFVLFVPLESLDRERLTECLSPEHEKEFVKWRSDGQAPAWFFLDAVDELKLTEGKLDRALNRLSREINGHLHRVHVIISCRASDWRPDQVTCPQCRIACQYCENVKIYLLVRPKKYFLNRLSRNQDMDIRLTEESMKSRVCLTSTQPEEFDSIEDDIQTVAMLPMSGEEIERFVEQYGMDNPAAFLDEVFKQRAWPFACRPLDLINLITSWNDQKRLGTRAEQYETNVRKQIERRSRTPGSGSP